MKVEPDTKMRRIFRKNRWRKVIVMELWSE